MFATTLLLPMLCVVTSHVQMPSPAELLEKGIYAEETQGDLTTALDLYSKVIAAASEAGRPVVAQALLRLGMCHLKGGRVDDARVTFEKLAQRYAEQKSIVAKIPDTTIQLTVPPERARQIGLFLTRVLRHDPAAAGIQLDAGGWAGIDALISGSGHRGFPIERGEFDEVVRTSDKHRFAISKDGTHIRATYGHSVRVELGLSPLMPTSAEEETRGRSR